MRPPGVPPLLDVNMFDLASIAYRAVNATGLPRAAPSLEWGLYDASNQPYLVADSVLSIAYLNDARIADYPMERGSFESYNKVQTPFAVRVRLAKASGGPAERQAFLQRVENAQRSLALYSVVTPEVTYRSANIERYSYRRDEDEGAGMIVVDIDIREVRIKTVPASTGADAASTGDAPAASPLSVEQVKTPVSASAQALGQVKALIPTVAQVAATGFVAGSLNDVLSKPLSKVASAQIALGRATPSIGASMLTDRLANPPAFLSLSQLPAYTRQVTAVLS